MRHINFRSCADYSIEWAERGSAAFMKPTWLEATILFRQLVSEFPIVFHVSDATDK